MDRKKAIVCFPKRAAGHLVTHVTKQIGVGVLIVVPFLIVYGVVKWVAYNIDALFEPVIKIMPFVDSISGIGIILLLIMLYTVGLTAMYTFGRKAIHFVQNITLKIPFIKNIYKPAKDLTSLAGENPLGESRVVGTYLYNSQAFAYGLYASLVIEKGERFVNFLHLTSPAPPTLGPILAVPEKNVYEIMVVSEDGNETHPMAPGELLQLVLSGGISSPKNILRRPLAPK